VAEGADPGDISQALAPHLAAEIHADVMGSDHCPISITLDGI